MDFYETVMGRRFFEGTMPELNKNVEKLTKVISGGMIETIDGNFINRDHIIRLKIENSCLYDANLKNGRLKQWSVIAELTQGTDVLFTAETSGECRQYIASTH